MRYLKNTLKETYLSDDHHRSLKKLMQLISFKFKHFIIKNYTYYLFIFISLLCRAFSSSERSSSTDKTKSWVFLRYLLHVFRIRFDLLLIYIQSAVKFIFYTKGWTYLGKNPNSVSVELSYCISVLSTYPEVKMGICNI